MLSRHERQVLREIELSVTKDDPDFAAMLCGEMTPPPHSRRYQLVVMTAIAGMLAALLGLLFFSAVLMIGGACVALSAWLRALMMRWANES